MECKELKIRFEDGVVISRNEWIPKRNSKKYANHLVWDLYGEEAKLLSIQ